MSDTTTLPITERIKTYEDACKELNRSPLTVEQFLFLPEADRQAFFSLHCITTAIEALNEGWQPDWNDYDEDKYYPYFDMETYDDQPAGSGFSFDVCVYGRTRSLVGARLVLKSASLARYVGQQFESDYKNWFKK